MINEIKKLMEDLINDEEYKEYISIYKEESYVNKDMLDSLLKKHLDLYYIFLKINILLYRYETKSLNKELKDYKHYRGNTLYVDDIDIVMDYYYNNYPRCRRELSKIITYKLRPMTERKILKQIIDRQPSEEFKPFPFNDESEFETL